MLKSEDSIRLQLLQELDKRKLAFNDALNRGIKTAAVMAPLSLRVKEIEDILYKK